MGKHLIPKISIRLPADTHHRLADYLQDNPGKSRNRVITEAIEAYLLNYYPPKGQNSDKELKQLALNLIKKLKGQNND